jgi:hypothetical protein
MRYIPNPSCCRPPSGVTDNEARNYLCPRCLSMYDRQVNNLTNNSLSERKAPMSEPLRQYTLNFQQGREAEIVEDSPGVPCRCNKGPLPELSLHFKTDTDGGTISSIVENGSDHSFDSAGLQPIKVGGSHSTDEQYRPAPKTQSPVEEVMSDGDLQRIGLKGSSGPLETPTLVFRKDANRQTVSEIV